MTRRASADCCPVAARFFSCAPNAKADSKRASGLTRASLCLFFDLSSDRIVFRKRCGIIGSASFENLSNSAFECSFPHPPI